MASSALWPRPGVWAATVTGLVDATDLETTAGEEGWGQVTRQRRITDRRGKGHAIEVTGYGGKVIIGSAARTPLPLAATVVPIQEPEVLSRRALGTQARPHLASHARWHPVVCEKGWGEGVDVWWRAQHGIVFVVPAKDNLAVTVDAQAQAAAGEGRTVGRRVHTVRQGQGHPAWTERWETAVGGITGLTTDAPYGTPEPGWAYHRRDGQPTLINAVVVRQGNGHASGLAGNTVCWTNASVQQPLRPCDDDEDRRLIEPGCRQERKQPWRVQPPPQQTARAVRVHVMFTWRLFALATAYRWPWAPEAPGGEPVGWQRWRRQRLEQTRDLVIVFAQDT